MSTIPLAYLHDVLRNYLSSQGLFIWPETSRPDKVSYSPKQALCLYGIELLGICCMIATWCRNGAKTQKGFKSFETLKNVTKCRQNTRISVEQFRKTYLSICMYFWAIIFQMQSTYILFRAAELPGQSVYMEFTWKIFISPRRYPTSVCRNSPRRVNNRLHHVNSHPGLL
jgi:hypothetical protein